MLSSHQRDPEIYVSSSGGHGFELINVLMMVMMMIIMMM